MNSSADDFHLIYDTKNGNGYLTSNRNKLGLNDDLFNFTKTESSESSKLHSDVLETEIKVDQTTKRKITIIDKEENIPVNGVKIFDDKKNLITISDSNGIALIDSSNLEIILFKDGYNSKEIVFNDFKSDNNYQLKRMMD